MSGRRKASEDVGVTGRARYWPYHPTQERVPAVAGVCKAELRAVNTSYEGSESQE